MRPTADCIWNSFLTSGKRHLILTGMRKSGKTTLLKKICPPEMPGITTFAEPGKCVWLMDNVSGMKAMVGVFDETIEGHENRMRICREGFEGLGIQVIERCLSAENERVSIDEIGYLECNCDAYMDGLRRLMDAKRVIAAVRKQDIPFLKEICNRSDVFCIDLDKPFGNTGCVIMASGMGKRFGGNKLMADFNGKPMIQRVIETTDGIFVRRIVVTRHDEVADLCRSLSVDVILHDKPFRSDTVRLGIETMDGMDACLFCPGDQPLISRDTLMALAVSGTNDGESIFRVCFEDTPGSPILFPKRDFRKLMELPEGRGGGYIAMKSPERVKMVPVRNQYELMDADTPEEFKALMEIDGERQ